MAFLKIERFRSAIGDLVFPPVCACCGDHTLDPQSVICTFCLQSRFEEDVDDDSILLPDCVHFRFALWQFDKMGYLQDLLHKLKYDHLSGVGTRLGMETGRVLKKTHWLNELPETFGEPVLIPVPLHRKRYRSRGYNQSRIIAEGISRTTGIELISEGVITRQKNTKTQTGLNSQQRTKNLDGAYHIRSESMGNRFAVIVDDVYTTGATTFELAGLLHDRFGIYSAIVTIART